MEGSIPDNAAAPAPGPTRDGGGAETERVGRAGVRSHVEVELELVRVRTQLERRDLVLALVVDPRLDQVRREDVALEEELVVGLEAVQHGAEGGRDLGHARVLLGASS